MANKYDQGDLIRVTGTWTDPLNSDAAIDPTDVYITVTTPSGVGTTLHYGVDAELKKTSVGIYYYEIDVTEPGTWTYRFYSTGTGQAAGKQTFLARSASA